jgi:hypothetical protein
MVVTTMSISEAIPMVYTWRRGVSDVSACSTTSSDRTQQAALAITNGILGEIPG